MRDFVVAFAKWESNPEQSFATLFRRELKETGLYDPSWNIRMIISEISYYFDTFLSVQAFVNFNEILKNNNFDTSIKNDEFNYKKLKSTIDVDGVEKTMNPSKLLKVIRESFAHNDDNEESNWYSDEQYLVIKSVKDKEGNRHNLKISLSTLLKLITTFLGNAYFDNYNTMTLKMADNKLKRSLSERTLTPAQIGKMFSQGYTKTEGIQELDKFQKQALYNCLTVSDYFIENDCEHLNIELITELFPEKANSYFVGCSCMDASLFVKEMETSYTSLSDFMSAISNNIITEVSENLKFKYNDDFLQFWFGTPQLIDSILINNLLFYMFTFESEENLKKCFREDVDIRRVRNSLMHGRHFYNYDMAFEFYDGVKELEHIATITTDEVFKAIDILVHNYIEERDKNNLSET